MTKWHYIKHLFRLITGRSKPPAVPTGHTIEVAFYSGGKPYYRLSDQFSTFVERGLDAYQVYEELSMRMDAKDLMEYITKIEEKLNANPIKVQDIAVLVNLLKERATLPLAPRDMIWKLASVAYFDDKESPYTYDSTYAQKKIETWQVNKDVDDFFLYKQLRDLIPLPELSKETYQALQKTMGLIIDHHSKLLSGYPSPKPAAPSSSKGKK